MIAPANIYDPKWRFEERVQRLVKKGLCTRAEAEELVKNVILNKEAPFDKPEQS